MTKKKRITVGILAAVAAVLLGNTTVMAAAKAGEPVFSIETDQRKHSGRLSDGRWNIIAGTVENTN